MMEKIDLWSHRLYMIVMLPITISLGLIIGPFIGLEIVFQKFKEHW
jgi:hypothetical protein